MPRYFFHLHDAGTVLPDLEGHELPSLSAAIAETLREARGLIGHDAFQGVVRLGQRIDVDDEACARVHSLSFADAVRFEG